MTGLPAKAPQTRFERLAAKLAAAGCTLPAPIARFLEGEARPLALSVRRDLPAWCEAGNYSPEQAEALAALISELVKRPDYLEAVAHGGARINLDGQEDGSVAAPERAHARRRLAEQRGERQAAGMAAALDARPRPSSPSPAAPSLAALAEALDALPASPTEMPAPSTAPRRVPVVEVRKRRARAAAPRPEPAPARAAANPKAPARPSTPAPLPVPSLLVREVVERIGARRSAPRIIGRFVEVGRIEAAEDERSGWATDAIEALISDGYDRATATAQVLQLIDDMLVGIMPKRERR